MQLCYMTTVFNAETTIGATVESSFLADDKVSAHIIVDDGSTDGTPDVLEALKARHGDKLRIITTGRVGRANALNLALEEAESVADVAMNIDADDVSAPHRPAATERFYHPDLACCGGAAAMVHPTSS
ncbi:MAG: glycosyltransferase family A protein, partial [Actinomycetota bacterium]